MNETVENQVEEIKEVAEVKTTDTITCPHCGGSIEIERPVHNSTIGRRGKLSGVKLEDMTDEQLKVEIVNSKSVLYKATKRGAAADVIAKNQDRVNAADALKASRDAVKNEAKAVLAAETASLTAMGDAEKAAAEETVYAEDTAVANEI